MSDESFLCRRCGDPSSRSHPVGGTQDGFYCDHCGESNRVPTEYERKRESEERFAEVAPKFWAAIYASSLPGNDCDPKWSPKRRHAHAKQVADLALKAYRSRFGPAETEVAP